MSACQCWRCARCGALTRTWRGYMVFANAGGQFRPVCRSSAECKARVKDPAAGELWLDLEDGPQEANKATAPAPVQAPEVRRNLVGVDGWVWCFGCKPAGVVVQGSSGEECSSCGG